MLCHKSPRDYLLDIERNHKFFILSGEADALFVNIISRSPPSDRSYSRDELKGMLGMVTNWSRGLTVPCIAKVLDVDQRLVQSVVLGPAQALFREDTDGNIQLSTPSLKVFLHDSTRSGGFFVQAEDLDPIFTRILSLPPPSDHLSSYCRDDLLDVLTAVMIRDGPTTESEIEESLLGVNRNIVRHVVLGPAMPLFDSLNDKVQLSTSLLKPFLQDITRSMEFFIRGRDEIDAAFMRILSRQPPSDPSRSYSREVLMGVLRVVVAQGNWLKVPEIASLLEVAPSLVEGVVFGPAKALFKLDLVQDVDFSLPSFKDFLLDVNRAGEYFIPRDKPLDTLFIQILSRQPPSSASLSYSREVLVGVLRVLVVRSKWLSVAQIASSLDVDPAVVKAIVFGKPVFRIYPDGDIQLIPEVAKFLQDAGRAGEYYIPPNDLNPNYASLYAKINKIRSVR